MNKLTFAILMPFYQGDSISSLETTLKYAADCKFDKTYLVIDGPLDAERNAYIDELRQSQKLVILQLQHNSGLGAALNFGLNHVTENYCSRVDPGDIIFAPSVEKIRALIKTDPSIALIGGQMSEHTDNHSDRVRNRIVPLSYQKIKRFAKLRNPFNHITVCFRVDSVRILGGYPETQFRHEDYGLWIKFIQREFKILNIADIVSSASIADFTNRRLGVRYLSHEISFLKQNLDFFGFWVFPYIIIRLPFRLSGVLQNVIYKLIRS